MPASSTAATSRERACLVRILGSPPARVKAGAAAKILPVRAPLVVGIVVVASFLGLMLWTTEGHFVAQVSDLYVVAQYARALAEGHPFRYNAGEAPTSGATSLLHTAVLALADASGARGEGLIAFAVLLGAALYLASIPLAARVAERLSGPREGRLAGMLVALSGPVVWGFLYGSDIAPFLFLALLLLERWLAFCAGGPARGLAVAGSLLALCRPEGLPVGLALAAAGRWRRPASPRRSPVAVAAARNRPRRADAAAHRHRLVAPDVGRGKGAPAELRPRRDARRRDAVRRRRAARAAARALPARNGDRLRARRGRLLLPAAGARAGPARGGPFRGAPRRSRASVARSRLADLRADRPERVHGGSLQPLPDVGVPRSPRLRRGRAGRARAPRRPRRRTARERPVPGGRGPGAAAGRSVDRPLRGGLRAARGLYLAARDPDGRLHPRTAAEGRRDRQRRDERGVPDRPPQPEPARRDEPRLRGRPQRRARGRDVRVARPDPRARAPALPAPDACGTRGLGADAGSGSRPARVCDDELRGRPGAVPGQLGARRRRRGARPRRGARRGRRPRACRSHRRLRSARRGGARVLARLAPGRARAFRLGGHRSRGHRSRRRWRRDAAPGGRRASRAGRRVVHGQDARRARAGRDRALALVDRRPIPARERRPRWPRWTSPAPESCFTQVAARSRDWAP